MNTAFPTASQYLSDFKAFQQQGDNANRRDLQEAFGQIAEIDNKTGEPSKRGAAALGPMSSNTLLGVSASGAVSSLGAIAPVIAPIAAVGAVMLTVGWFAGQWKERTLYNRAVDIHESLQDIAKNAQSPEELIQGQQKILSDHRATNEQVGRDEAIDRRAYFMGAMAAGIIAGAVMAPALPFLGAAAVLAGAAGLGASLGAAAGEVRGQDKLNTMVDRIADRLQNFPGALEARRQGQAVTPVVDLDPSRPNRSF